MPALFDRDTNTPTMSGQNPFQSLDATTAASGQENQLHEQQQQQHKQVLEKKAAADKRYVLRVMAVSTEDAEDKSIKKRDSILISAQQSSLRQPFRRHHEPGQPEIVFFQAEADQQAVCLSQLCGGWRIWLSIYMTRDSHFRRNGSDSTRRALFARNMSANSDKSEDSAK